MQELLDKIYKWVEASGLQVKYDEGMSKMLEIDFVGSVQVKAIYSYNIAIVNKAEIIKISTYYKFDQKINNIMVQSKDNGFDFFSRVQLALLQMNLNYQFVHRNDTVGTLSLIKDIDPKNLESIEVSKLIYFDGFNGNLFINTVENVTHAAEVITLLFKKADLSTIL